LSVILKLLLRSNALALTCAPRSGVAGSTPR
jgi:hypothetical protein